MLGERDPAQLAADPGAALVLNELVARNTCWPNRVVTTNSAIYDRVPPLVLNYDDSLTILL